MRLYRTSVKDDLNVSVVFQHLAENYVNKVRDREKKERERGYYYCNGEKVENSLIELACFEMSRILSRF